MGYKVKRRGKVEGWESAPKDPAAVNQKRLLTIPYYPSISEKRGRILGRFDFCVSFRPIVKLHAYIGQTGNSFSTRLAQHRSALRLLYPQNSAVAEHAIEESHNIDWESSKVVDKKDFYFKGLFLEAWHNKSNSSMAW